MAHIVMTKMDKIFPWQSVQNLIKIYTFGNSCIFMGHDDKPLYLALITAKCLDV